MIFWRGKALYLYSTTITIRESQRKPREGSDCLKDDSEAFRKFPVPEKTFGKVAEASAKPQSRSESSRVKKTWTCSKNFSDFFEDDSEDFEEISSAWRNLWDGFPKVTEASVKLQSHSQSSRVEEALNIVFQLW